VTRTFARTALAVAAAACTMCAGGCEIGMFVGMMAESAHEAGSTRIPAEYTGLNGHSFAVVVDTDRAIRADHPGVVGRLTERINADLVENTDATGHIPTTRLLSVLYNNPQWRALSRGELGKRLGVDRLVVVDLNEYRLTDIGNRYVWDGFASATVEAYEIDTGYADEPVYDKVISVHFPDTDGVLRSRYDESFVNSALARRLANRAAWLFFDHDEPNSITY